MKLKQNKKILFACHDSGSGNIILNYIENYLDKKIKFDLLVSGPSKKICSQHHKKLKFNNFKINFKYPYSTVITGTSYYSSFEHKIRLGFSKNKDVKIIAVLDHWVNIEKRFKRGNEIILPNLIWCLDNKAKFLVKQKYLDIKIKLINNYYIDALLKKIKFNKKIKDNNILYLTEPIKFKYKKKYINEEYILDFFLKNIYRFNFKNYKIIIKLHPKENINKYDEWIKKNKRFNIKIDYENDLSSLLNISKVVVGFHTSALMLALQTNKKVYTSNPFSNKIIRIDHKKLLNFY